MIPRPRVIRISNYETIVEDDGVIPLFCYNYHPLSLPLSLAPQQSTHQQPTRLIIDNKIRLHDISGNYFI